MADIARLSLLNDGTVALRLKRPRRSDGATHVLLHHFELIDRLAALIPRPCLNSTLYGGVLPANAAWRAGAACPGRTCRPGSLGSTPCAATTAVAATSASPTSETPTSDQPPVTRPPSVTSSHEAPPPSPAFAGPAGGKRGSCTLAAERGCAHPRVIRRETRSRPIGGDHGRRRKWTGVQGT